MAKSTFYFVIIVLVAVDVVQGQYQKRLMQGKAKEINDPAIKVQA